MTDNVNHPTHYTSHPSGIECITVTEHMGFNLGNALKYIWRADLKGDAIEDLRKALWYVEREISLRQDDGGEAPPPKPAPVFPFPPFTRGQQVIGANGVTFTVDRLVPSGTDWKVYGRDTDRWVWASCLEVAVSSSIADGYPLVGTENER
jgi:hypothetical protein